MTHQCVTDWHQLNSVTYCYNSELIKTGTFHHWDAWNRHYHINNILYRGGSETYPRALAWGLMASMILHPFTWFIRNLVLNGVTHKMKGTVHRCLGSSSRVNTNHGRIDGVISNPWPCSVRDAFNSKHANNCRKRIGISWEASHPGRNIEPIRALIVRRQGVKWHWPYRENSSN